MLNYETKKKKLPIPGSKFCRDMHFPGLFLLWSFDMILAYTVLQFLVLKTGKDGNEGSIFSIKSYLTGVKIKLFGEFQLFVMLNYVTAGWCRKEYKHAIWVRTSYDIFN